MIMKLKKVISALLICMSFISFLSCENENGVSDETIIVKKNASQCSNPYDTIYHSLYIDFFSQLNDFVSESEFVSREDYDLKVAELKSKFDFEGLQKEELAVLDTTYSINLLRRYFRECSLYGNVYAYNVVNNDINSCDCEDKEKLAYFKLIALVNGVIESYNEVYYTVDNWDQRFDNCMFNEAYDIFETGSWIQQAVFMLTAADSLLIMIADCTYAATFTPMAQRCQERQPYKTKE